MSFATSSLVLTDPKSGNVFQEWTIFEGGSVYFVTQERDPMNPDDSSVVTTMISSVVADAASLASLLTENPPEAHPDQLDWIERWNKWGGNFAELRNFWAYLNNQSPRRENWPPFQHEVPEGTNLVDLFEKANPADFGGEWGFTEMRALGELHDLDKRPGRFDKLHQKLWITSLWLGQTPMPGTVMEYWAGLAKDLYEQMEKKYHPQTEAGDDPA